MEVWNLRSGRGSLLSSFTEPKSGGPEHEGIIVIEPGTLIS